MVAAELLGVVNVLCVHEALWHRQVLDLARVTALRFAGQRPAQVLLRLDVSLQHLQVHRAQEARRLPQDGDDPRGRLNVRYQPGGLARADVLRRSLADALA